MMHHRHIKHSHKPPVPQSAELEAAKQQIFSALITNVQRVQRHTPDGKSRPTGGVYVGIAGTVVMNYHLAGLRIPAPHKSLSPDILRSQAAKKLADALCLNPTGLSIPHSPSHASFLETVVGIATLALLKAIKSPSTLSPSSHTNDDEDSTSAEWRSCAQILRSTCQMSIAEDAVHSKVKDDDGCEVLYGRAGLLYALLLLRRETQDIQADSVDKSSDSAVAVAKSIATLENIENIVESIIVRGRTGATTYGASIASSGRATPTPPDLMWTWHHKRYLGAAHGIAGILQLTLMCPTVILARYAKDILNTVLWLVETQDPFGNWPSKAPEYDGDDSYSLSSLSTHKKGSDFNANELVQWCHGASGMLFMLGTLLQRATSSPQSFPLTPPQRATILASMLRGASLVYRHGLLRKGVGLCHGVAGSVYALLAVSSALAILPRTGPDAADSLVTTRSRHHEHHAEGSTDARAVAANEPTATMPEYYLMRAVHLARLATTHETLTAQREMNVPDRPWSLYKGMAGMCCAWGDVLARLQPPSPPASAGQGILPGTRSGMPGFDDIRVDENW
ncbi:hypothetical protein HGRIS_014425 [Hohenbuehelia grisea]